MLSFLFLLQRLWTIQRRLYRDNLSALVERHLVDAGFAMNAWFMVDEVLVDAMINNVPFILAWQLEDRVVSCSIDFLLWHLLDDPVVLLVNVDVAQW